MNMQQQYTDIRARARIDPSFYPPEWKAILKGRLRELAIFHEVSRDNDLVRSALEFREDKIARKLIAWANDVEFIPSPTMSDAEVDKLNIMLIQSSIESNSAQLSEIAIESAYFGLGVIEIQPTHLKGFELITQPLTVHHVKMWGALVSCDVSQRYYMKKTFSPTSGYLSVEVSDRYRLAPKVIKAIEAKKPKLIAKHILGVPSFSNISRRLVEREVKRITDEFMAFLQVFATTGRLYVDPIKLVL